MEEENKTEEQVSSRDVAGKILVLAVAVMIVAMGLYFMKKDPDPKALGDKQADQVVNQSGGAGINEEVFELSAKPFEFSQKEIRVKKGDTVRINLVVTQGLHDLVVDEFGVRTKQLKTGENELVVFTADKTGTFEYYCSVGNHRQMGMVGKLIVE